MSTKLYKLQCGNCEHFFKSKRSDAKYCGTKCRKEASRRAVTATVKDIAAGKQPKANESGELVFNIKPDPPIVIQPPETVTIIKSVEDIPKLKAAKKGLTDWQLALRKKKLGY